jgi:hypothetical protein
MWSALQLGQESEFAVTMARLAFTPGKLLENHKFGFELLAGVGVGDVEPSVMEGESSMHHAHFAFVTTATLSSVGIRWALEILCFPKSSFRS